MQVKVHIEGIQQANTIQPLFGCNHRSKRKDHQLWNIES